MRVAVLSESGVDEAVLRELLRPILCCDLEFLPLRVRRRGVDQIRRGKVFTATVYQGLYGRNFEGLVCVVDSDTSDPHDEKAAQWDPSSTNKDSFQACSEDCRLCLLRRKWVESAYGGRRKSNESPPLKVALGLAIPNIEAWLMVGGRDAVTEAIWASFEQRQRQSFVDRAKSTVFGDVRGYDRQREIAVGRIREILTAHGLQVLERSFPQGFGALVNDLRRWQTAHSKIF